MFRIKSKRKKRYYYHVFITVFGLTIMLSPIISRVINDFKFQLVIKNKTSASTYPDGQIIIDQSFKNSPNIIGDYPTRIIIPKYNIDLDVKLSKLIGGVWEIHDEYANFGIGSSLPGEVGNTVIFAHAKVNLFGELINITEGDLISIQTKDGNWFNYKTSLKKEVSPDQTEVVSQSPDKRLTLFTCSGFADLKRLVITASLLENKTGLIN